MGGSRAAPTMSSIGSSRRRSGCAAACRRRRACPSACGGRGHGRDRDRWPSASAFRPSSFRMDAVAGVRVELRAEIRRQVDRDPPSPVVIDQSSFIVVPGAARNVIEPSPVCSFTVVELAGHADAAVAGVDVEVSGHVFQRDRSVAGRQRQLAGDVASRGCCRRRSSTRAARARARSGSSRRRSSPSRCPSRGIVTISFAVGDMRPTPKNTTSCAGFFTSTSMRSPSCFVSTFSCSMASLVGPRFSISTTTRLAVAGANLDRAVERRQLQVRECPVTVKRFSSRVMCPCESTTTQPARRERQGGRQGQGRKYRFHTLSWTGSAAREFESEQFRTTQVWTTRRSRSSTTRSAMAPAAMTPKPCRPSARAGRRGADGRRVREAEPDFRRQLREGAVHRQRAARERAVVEIGGVADGNRAAADVRLRAPRQPRSGRAVGDRHDPLRAAWRRCATRIIAGCTWTPSQMSSAVTSSDSRTAPASPGARCDDRRHAR